MSRHSAGGDFLRFNMQRVLPLGRSTFQTLRVRNEIYVDKTTLVFELASYDSKIFLARPRRFGKTLLTSTFESLFKDGLKYFHGLAIEKLWKDKTYPVIKLDFSEIKEFSNAAVFKNKFEEKIRAVFASIGFKFVANDLSVMTQLSSFLSSLEPASLVILIDEYDAPLTHCLDNPKLFEEIRSIMSELFLILKSNEGCQRFFFMTGITKFSNTSIFSAFNNLQDISLDPRYGNLLGYSDEEIKTNFSSYLNEAANALHITAEEVFSELKRNYDGFAFDEKASIRVYCPWSVLCFLSRPDRGFQNYWFESGGQPTVLLRYLKNHALQSPIAYKQSIIYSLSGLRASRQYDEIDPEALLLQTGYLTIKSLEGGDFVRLDYPNEEVAVSMARLYAENLLRQDRTGLSAVARLEKTLSTGNLDEIVGTFNRVLTSIDYHRYPIHDESSCRAYLQVLMIGAALIPRVEVHNAFGRSGLEVETGRRHWIFELKYAKKSADASSRLEEALHQTTVRRYGEGDASDKELLRVALVFSEEARAFVAWRLIP